MSLANRRTDLHALNNFSSLIDKVSFKKNSMSLGLVVLEKMFMRTPTPQSDDIKNSLVKQGYDGINRCIKTGLFSEI